MPLITLCQVRRTQGPVLWRPTKSAFYQSPPAPAKRQYLAELELRMTFYKPCSRDKKNKSMISFALSLKVCTFGKSF